MSLKKSDRYAMYSIYTNENLKMLFDFRSKRRSVKKVKHFNLWWFDAALTLFYNKELITLGSSWNSWKTTGIPGKLLEFLEIPGIPGKLLEFLENSWNFLKIPGNSGKLLEFLENSWNFVIIRQWAPCFKHSEALFTVIELLNSVTVVDIHSL